MTRRTDGHLLTKPLMKMGTVTGKTERHTASWIRSDLFKSYISLRRDVARVIIVMVVTVICNFHISYYFHMGLSLNAFSPK